MVLLLYQLAHKKKKRIAIAVRFFFSINLFVYSLNNQYSIFATAMNIKPLSLLSGRFALYPILCSILFISCLSTSYGQDLPENTTISDINSLRDDIGHRTKQDIEASNVLEEKRRPLSTNFHRRILPLPKQFHP